MADVFYRIARPEQVVAEGRAQGIILPTGEINFTVIAGCSPCMIKLERGIVQILDEQGKVSRRFCLDGGLATIADDKCRIAGEVVWDFADLDMAQVLAQATDSPFYEMIVEAQKAFKD